MNYNKKRGTPMKPATIKINDLRRRLGPSDHETEYTHIMDFADMYGGSEMDEHEARRLVDFMVRYGLASDHGEIVTVCEYEDARKNELMWSTILNHFHSMTGSR